MRRIDYADGIWAVEDFLTAKECDELIYYSEMQGFEAATVSLPEGAKLLKGIRNNDRLIMEDAGLAGRLWERLRGFCPVEIEGWRALRLGERFRFYRYEGGQRFKRHIDGRVRISEAEESRLTFLVYLNEDYEGGETQFDGVVVRPKRGWALCFVHELKHESLPIVSGCKYALRSDIFYTSDRQ